MDHGPKGLRFISHCFTFMCLKLVSKWANGKNVQFVFWDFGQGGYSSWLTILNELGSNPTVKLDFSSSFVKKSKKFECIWIQFSISGFNPLLYLRQIITLGFNLMGSMSFTPSCV